VEASNSAAVELDTFESDVEPKSIYEHIDELGVESRRSVNIAELERWYRGARKLAEELEEPFPDIPETRADCPKERPCPHVRCRHHLYLDVSAGGSIKFNFPGLEVWELKETCSIDVADRGELSLEDIAELMGMSKGAAEKVFSRVLLKISQQSRAKRMRDAMAEGVPYQVDHHLGSAQREAPGKEGWLSREDTRGKGPWTKKKR